jgi:5-methylcytosine-specific restriction endonuclease McrA
MRRYENTAQFYKSDDWATCKAQVLNERIRSDGIIICEHCGQPIIKGFNPNANNNAGAIVFHHKIYLNNYNVNDASVSINPENIAILHWNCHNEIHGRFTGGIPEKKVYLITGAPCSGKTSFVRERIQPNDLILDIDDLWQTISGQPRYTKPNSLKTLVFAVREELKGLIGRGAGTWRNAFIVEALPVKMDRQREIERYKAHNVEIITMAATQEVCLQRLYANANGRDIKQYESYIKEYFERYSE